MNHKFHSTFLKIIFRHMSTFIHSQNHSKSCYIIHIKPQTQSLLQFLQSLRKLDAKSGVAGVNIRRYDRNLVISRPARSDRNRIELLTLECGEWVARVMRQLGARLRHKRSIKRGISRLPITTFCELPNTGFIMSSLSSRERKKTAKI